MGIALRVIVAFLLAGVLIPLTLAITPERMHGEWMVAPILLICIVFVFFTTRRKPQP